MSDSARLEAGITTRGLLARGMPLWGAFVLAGLLLVGWEGPPGLGALAGHGLGLLDLLLTALATPAVLRAPGNRAFARYLVRGFAVRLGVLVLAVLGAAWRHPYMLHPVAILIAYIVQFFGIIGVLSVSVMRASPGE